MAGGCEDGRGKALGVAREPHCTERSGKWVSAVGKERASGAVTEQDTREGARGETAMTWERGRHAC